ncbi:hypothetical protein JNB_11189 [Janibacter sp. HTCC2649]|nr:hypothetical protein JNB_11189 [Janibacter sp. HTCC2649]
MIPMLIVMRNDRALRPRAVHATHEGRARPEPGTSWGGLDHGAPATEGEGPAYAGGAEGTRYGSPADGGVTLMKDSWRRARAAAHCVP